MKIQEFREKIKTTDRERLEKLAAELYKQIPKHKKEGETNVLIEEILSGEAKNDSGVRAKNAPIDFAALKSGIALFLEYADQGYYYAPSLWSDQVEELGKAKDDEGICKCLEKVEKIQTEEMDFISVMNGN